MRRIRIALVIFSVATLALVGTLAWSALGGLALERAVRHEAVAERVFEEMERSLSRTLEREEARPFDHYRFYRADGERSPLSVQELEPFVVGAFQIDPDGAVTTPLVPSDPALGRARGDWPPDPEVAARVVRIQETVASLWTPGAKDAAIGAERARASSGSFRREAEAAGEPADQAPGTTRALSGPGLASQQAARLDADLAKKQAKEGSSADEASSAYEVLQRLNRTSDSRSERKQKITRARPSVVYDAAPTEPELAEQRQAEDPYFGVGLDSLYDDENSSPPAPDAASAPRSPAPAASRRAVRIALDPMVGMEAGLEYLVLYRTVLVGARGYRQGLLIDRTALGGWLQNQVIDRAGLGRATDVSFERAPPPAPSDARFVFVHRFAEPFDRLTARLSLAPLPGVGSPWALYALVALLLGLGATGLVAVYRMVSVVVHYAERRSNFVASVTHELKTPLTAIRMYAEMLRDGLVPDDAKRSEYYGTITDESERLSRLVDNVLEFSRLEGGRRELNVNVGAVGPVLQEAAEKLRAHAEREGFRLEVLLEPRLPAVRFDRDALIQVLFNLVDNAMKYARDSQERIVRLEARRSGSGVTVSVRDFGPGVSRRHLDQIFEPFYRGESELTRTSRGTGIGLALVKELAERMGAGVSGGNASDGGFRVGLAFPAAEGG